MNENDQRIAIAEFCGAKWLYNPKAETPVRILILPTTSISHSYDFEEAPNSVPIGYEYFIDSLPDYFNDLDAMYDAEKHLNVNQIVKYVVELGDIMSDKGLWDAIHSTAEERANAFLRTIKQ